MLTRQQRNKLRRNGFTDYEVGQIAEDLRVRPQQFDLSEPAWQHVLGQRKAWVKSMIDKGETIGNIRHMINMWNWQSKKINPIWGLLRAEYARIYGPRISNFQKAYAKKDAAKRDMLYKSKKKKKTYAQIRGRE